MHHPCGPAIGLGLALTLASCATTPATPVGAAPAGGSAPVSIAARASGSAPAIGPTPAVTVSGATSTPYPAATPVGMVLPTSCSYIGAPIVSADSRTWYVDCRASSFADARGPLMAAFTQQGWTPCGTGPLRALWAKGTTVLTVTDSPGGDTQIAESSRVPGQCP